MRKNGALLLSVLLAMSFGACASLSKKPAEGLTVQHTATASENGDDEEESADDSENDGDTTSNVIRNMLNLEEKIVEFHDDHDKYDLNEYRQWTDEKGVRHIEMKGPQNNPHCHVFAVHLDGTKVISSGNGNPMKMVEEKPGSRIYLIDINGNGIFDRRVTITFFARRSVLGSYWQRDYAFEKRNPDKSWEKTRSMKAGSHSHRSDFQRGAW